MNVAIYKHLCHPQIGNQHSMFKGYLTLWPPDMLLWQSFNGGMLFCLLGINPALLDFVETGSLIAQAGLRFSI